MKITRRKLASITIAIIKEITISPKNIGIDYSNKYISVWFYDVKEEDEMIEHFSIYSYSTLRDSLKTFKKIVEEIRR